MEDKEFLEKLYQIVAKEKEIALSLHDLIDALGEANDCFIKQDREKLIFRIWLLSLESYISSLSIAIFDPYSASTVCRCAMEYSMVLILLWQNEELHKEIIIFTDMSYEFNKKKDKNIYLNYMKEKGVAIKNGKVPNNYELYGWIDSIRKNNGVYSFKNVTKCLKKYDKKTNAFYENYKILCTLVHPNRIYANYCKAQVLSNLVDIINDIFIYYINTLIDNYKISNNVLEKMKSDLDTMSIMITTIKDNVFSINNVI